MLHNLEPKILTLVNFCASFALFSALDPDIVPKFFDLYKRSALSELFDFIKYLDKTYMNVNSTYPPSMWAGILSTTLPTTTNGCESFHSAFGRLFGDGTTHPNMFAFWKICTIIINGRK